MAISAARMEQLRQEFIPVKNKIDQIDRKYSLNFKEPVMEMPESLDLPKLEYVEKSEAELKEEADNKVKASYIAGMRSLENRYATKLANIEKRRQEAAEKARSDQVKYLADFTRETNALRQKLVDNGMLFSSVIDRMTARLRVEYEQNVTESNKTVEQKDLILADERESLDKSYYNEKDQLDKERAAKSVDEYNKLLKSEQNKLISIEKYNAQLDEKEKKYQMARAKALENARQAEYNRSFAAKKLYQQMGATGYEQAKLWEKYNVLTSHFANFTKREEAMTLIEADAYVQTHLQQYYTTLIDWVNRNVPV